MGGVVDEIVIDPGGEFTATAAAPTAQEEAGELTTELFVDVNGTLIDIPAAEAGPLADGQSVSVTLTIPDGMNAQAAIAEVGQPADPVSGPAVEVAAVEPAPASSPLNVPSEGGNAGLATLASHTLRILPVFWSSRDSASRVSLQTVADETARFWSDQSNGALVTSTRVNDWVQITDPGSCNATALYNAAMAANHEAAPTSVRDHVVVYFPYRADCGGWAGMGSVNGSKVWVNGYPRTDVVAHEIGHNLGLGHANQLTCTSGGAAVPLSSTCTMREYYDGADVMGYSTGQQPGNLNTALASVLGFVQVIDASPTAAVTVDLAPLSEPGQVRALRIPMWDGSDLYVDYRPAAARDLRVPGWAGVQVHRTLAQFAPPTSDLLNMQAALGSSLVSMRPGSTYAIPGSDYTLSVATVGHTSARVRVAVTDESGNGYLLRTVADSMVYLVTSS
ncbi:MAG: reprolysin-like metallopeptidase, partial [Cellulomonas sp.]